MLLNFYFTYIIKTTPPSVGKLTSQEHTIISRHLSHTFPQIPTPMVTNSRNPVNESFEKTMNSLEFELDSGFGIEKQKSVIQRSLTRKCTIIHETLLTV